MATQLFVPDVAPITCPQDGISVEEARKILVAMGYAQVANAQGQVENGGAAIRFQRPVGGEKGDTR